MFAIESFGKLRHLTGITQQKFESLASDVRSHYRSFDSRLNGGKWRHIDNPRSDLKSVQSTILNFLREVELPDHMYGAKRGGSVQQHARLHAGQPCILALDLRNCFPRTSHEQVHRVFLNRVGCIPSIARLLTQLCTLDYHLPQGAPTSGYLAHLALLDLYEDLSKIATDHDLRFSMYVDDIAMSGSRPQVTAAMGKALSAIQRARHGVRNQKKQLMSGDARQLTGIAVRERIHVPASYLLKLENLLIRAAQVGTATASDFASLRGKLKWVRSIEPKEAERLENIMRYVESGTKRRRVFAESKPCSSHESCLWRKAQSRK